MSTKRKKQLFDDMLNEISKKPTSVIDTSVNTSVKAPEKVSTSVSVLEPENIDVNEPVVDSANEIVYDSEIVDESISGDKSDFGMGDIHKFINEAINVRELQKQIKSKKKKVKFEESHSKRTLWIRRDIQEILDMEVKNGGNITKEVNAALQLWFNLKSKGLL